MKGDKYRGLDVIYNNIINPSDGVIKDLIEVLMQKVAEDPTFSWEIAAKILFSVDNILSTINMSIFNKIGEVIKKVEISVNLQVIEDFKKKFNDEQNSNQSYSHVGFIKFLVNKNKMKVLMVAHSQGALFANIDYRETYRDPEIVTRSFSILPIASPANHVEGYGPYLTSTRDLVINGLRYLISNNVLPGNIELPYSFADLKGHSFLNIYTNPDMEARNKVSQLIDQQLDILKDPPFEQVIARYSFRYNENISTYNNVEYFDYYAGPKSAGLFDDVEYFNKSGAKITSREFIETVGITAATELDKDTLPHKFIYRKNIQNGKVSEYFEPAEYQERNVKSGVDRHINKIIQNAEKMGKETTEIESDWPNKVLKVAVCKRPG